jgi:hypothetical protein
MLGILQTRRRYVRLGYWLLEERLFRSLLWNLITGDITTFVPYFTLQPRRRAFSKILREWKFRGGFRAVLGADAICIRNNVRAFYPEFSLKVLLSRSRDVENMRNDVSARERILPLGTVHLPRILQNDCDGRFPFIKEELVLGRRMHPRHDADALRALIQGPLWETYRKAGFELRKIGDMISLDGMRPLLSLCCAVRQWPLCEGFLEKTLALMNGDRLLLCSFGHGDLGYSNVLMTDDHVPWILDWECAREMPVACDLIRLILDLPEGGSVLTERMAALAMDTGLPCRHQFLVAVTEKLLQWARLQKDVESARRESFKIAAYMKLANDLL